MIGYAKKIKACVLEAKFAIPNSTHIKRDEENIISGW
jgi:hypothetical protein